MWMILVLAALLGSCLCAQTPSVKPFEPGPEPQAATPVQTSNPAAMEQKQELSRRVFSPPARTVLPAIIPYVSGRVTLAPGKPCAIPLLEVMPKGGFTGDPKIMIMGSQTLANIDHMPPIKGVPACPQDGR